MSNYALKDVQVYCKTEWLANSKKRYRRVFENQETSYIYCEFSFHNLKFKEEDWVANINLKASSMAGWHQELCNLTVEKKVSKDDAVVAIREGWGNANPGVYWTAGGYKWEAYIDGQLVGTRKFYVNKAGLVEAWGENPYFDIASVKLYEGPYEDTVTEMREYYTDFHAAETRYLWVEMEGLNKLEDTWKCELKFLFFNDGMQLKGITYELFDVVGGQRKFSRTSGWGSNYKGSWKPGRYLCVIQFMDKAIGSFSFTMGDGFVAGETVVRTRPLF